MPNGCLLLLPLPVDYCCFSALVATGWLLPPTIAVVVTAVLLIHTPLLFCYSQ